MSHKKLENKFPGVKFWYPELSNINPQAEIGRGTTVHAPVWIGDQVKIGRACRIEAFAFIPPGLTIEDNVFIGPHVCFTNDRKPPSNEWGKILVKRGARIGANATILAGVTIGERALIGMGSVVLRDVPGGETWVGVPARPIGV